MNVTKTYVMLPVSHMRRAIEFYESVFGLPLLYETADWSELQCADTVSIALHGGMETGADSGLGFQVENLEEACRAVEAAGGAIRQEPQDRPGEPIRLARVADTEGNEISLAEPLG